jgi:hypothetical protein
MITFKQAIARMEGFGASTSNLPTRNNNPGDLDKAPWEKTVISTGRFAKFTTPEDGWHALETLLLKSYIGLTVEAAINKYAPPCENNTHNYVTEVCKWTGFLPSTILTSNMIKE